jgi:predicted glutamine amidotransferase
MCGIWGFVGDIPTTQVTKFKSFMKQASITGIVRGEDGTGMFMVPKKEGETIIYAKEPLPGFHYIHTKGFQSIERQMYEACAVVGHNRATTIGDNSYANTHPFVMDNLIGVHNGTIRGYVNLPGITKQDDFDVDSQYLYKSLSDNIETPETTLKEVNGAYALVWYDLKKKKLFFTRNEDRPLYIAKVIDENIWMFMSEPDHLLWLAGRNNINIEFPEPIFADNEGGVLWSVDPRKPTKPSVRSYTTKKPIAASGYLNQSSQGYYIKTKKSEGEKGKSEGQKIRDKRSETYFKYFNLKHNDVVPFILTKWIPNESNPRIGRGMGHTFHIQDDKAMWEWVEVHVTNLPDDSFGEKYTEFKDDTIFIDDVPMNLIVHGVWKDESNYYRIHGRYTPTLKPTNKTLENWDPDIDFEEYFDESINGPGLNNFIKLDEQEKLLGEGCAQCGCNLTLNTAKWIRIEGRETPFCEVHWASRLAGAA